ncbi:hypothetical protein L7F22_047415 [Adiantum nelumboides]|nr:hypothetical protein [Adiantum nelumboides]
MQQMYPHAVNHGLMRYHSAPSSMLASLIDIDEPDLAIAGDSATFAQFEETEFAQFLDDHLSNLVINSSALESISSEASAGNPNPQCPSAIDFESSNKNFQLQPKKESFTFEESHSGFSTNASLSPGPMSSALAHVLLETNGAASSGASNPMSLDMGQMDISEIVCSSTSSPAHAFPSLLAEKTMHLEGHSAQRASLVGSTLPTDSRMECLLWPSDGAYVNLDHVKLGDRGADKRDIPQLQTANVPRPVMERESGLLRQYSSPAEFFYHLSSDVMSPVADTRVPFSGNSLKEENMSGEANLQAAGRSYTIGSRRSKHEQDFCSFHRTQSSESSSGSGKALHNYAEKSLSGGLAETEILCRVSAKRGCATHPRSIAERVRRTKINEGIKKLQELVPVTEKFTNTVTMLDEAAEYIKYLQRQVEELSASRQHCTGICHAEGR